jgi:hypothetical protein
MTAPETVEQRLKQLRDPFPPEQVGKLPKGGVFLDYVGHADVTARLLEVDPFWTWEPFAVDAQGLPARNGADLWIRLTICGVTRIGVGDGKSTKECIGDAIRNAAMRFGVALELWAKGDRDYDREQAATETVRPEWYTATLDAIFNLPADKKEGLRQWMEQEKLSHVPASWDEAVARAIRHRIHQITSA